MENVALLFVCLGIGLMLQRVQDFPKNGYVALNLFLIYVSLPSVALMHIPNISIDTSLLFPVFTAYIVFFLSIPVILAVSKWKNWDRATTGCIILTAGLGNTSFIGFPVIEALYGAEGLSIALLVDQPGSFVVVSTFGVIVASYFAGTGTQKRVIFKRVLFFPPFIAFVAAVLLLLINMPPTGIPLKVIQSLAATLTPLALISIGLQLKINLKGQRLSPVVIGLSYKLLLAPLFLFLIYAVIMGGSGLPVKVSILEAAMAPMVTGSILAITYNLNPRLASLMVGIGVIVSFITLAGWYFIVEFFL